jgi:hypothetical protein
MNRNIRKLAPYFQSVVYLRKDAQRQNLATLVTIFTRTEQEILQELLRAVLQPNPRAKTARLSPDEMKSLRFLLRGIRRLPEESLHALAAEMEKEAKRRLSQPEN